MAESSIEWTHYTFNPWHGCFKVSEGCKHCYAETLSNRFEPTRYWGPPGTTPRKLQHFRYWQTPYTWQRRAELNGTRYRVFCASMADVFEDHPSVVESRERLWQVIRDTPLLDWLLLTKRPENVLRMTPWGDDWRDGAWPANVWIGTSVENQDRANERIPLLQQIPARVRFLSCEPLLGPLDISQYLLAQQYAIPGQRTYWNETVAVQFARLRKGIDWVIVGAESGHGARPMDEQWVRDLRDQCAAVAVPLFYKQRAVNGKKISLPELDGRQWADIPA